MGRKTLYGEETIMLSFRCPKSKAKDFNKLVYDLLFKYRPKQNTVVSKKLALGVVGNRESETVDYRIGSVAVDSLPTNRVLMSTGSYLGLYSANKRYYTNKIVGKVLEVLEWKEIAQAKKYLDWINKK